MIAPLKLSLEHRFVEASRAMGGIKPGDAAGSKKLEDFFKKPKKVGRPKGSVKKQKPGRPAAKAAAVVVADADVINADDTAKQKKHRPDAKKFPTKPKEETRGATKTDWSTPANQELLAGAQYDWDNKTGKWEDGDTYRSFGEKYGIPKVGFSLTDLAV